MNTPTINRLLARIDQTRQQLGGKLGALTLGFALALSASAAPEITQHLRTQLVLDGEAATFIVGTNPNTEVTYEWVHNGDVLTGETSSTLTLGAVDRDAAGWYQVRATDGTGTSTSVAHLHVAPQRGAAVTWSGHYDFEELGLPVVPEVRLVRQVDAGEHYNLALIGDGQVIAWGYDRWGSTVVPADLSGVVAIAAGERHGLALRDDGTVVAWGGYESHDGRAEVPAGLTDVVAIAAGSKQSVALRADGTLVYWGFEYEPVPTAATDVVAIEAAANDNLALTVSGELLTWGRNIEDQITIPADLGPVRLMAGGDRHAVAVTTAGEVRSWGEGIPGSLDVPMDLPPLRRLAGGRVISMAITEDHSLVGWGIDTIVTEIPTETAQNTWDFGVGEVHAIALVETDPPEIVLPPRVVSAPAGGLVGFDVLAAGLGPLTYQWFHDGVPVPEDPDYQGQQTEWLELRDLALEDAGEYTVAVTNAVGTTTSVAVTLTVAPRPVVTASPLSQLLTVGEAAQFSITATGPAPLTYLWKHDGVPLAGAEAATLSIGSVARADAGFYTVEVTDADGGFAVRHFELHVTEHAFERTAALSWGQIYAYTDVPDVSQLSDLVAIKSAEVLGQAVMALQDDGQLLTLPYDYNAPVPLPSELGTVAAFASSGGKFLALDTEGRLWIWDGSGVLPEQPRHRGLVKLLASRRQVLGLRDDGRVLRIIRPYYESEGLPETLPLGHHYASTDGSLSMVDAAGVVTMYGVAPDYSGRPTAPLGPVTALAAGDTHYVASRADGTVALWGEPLATTVPMPNDLNDVVAVSGGSGAAFALRADGKLEGWGEEVFGEITDIPTGQPLLSFSAGSYSGYALIAATPPVVTAATAPTEPIEAGGTLTLAVEAAGAMPITYQWLKDGVAIPGETGVQLSLDNVQASDAGSYAVRMTNALGESTSTAFPITINGGDGPPQLRRARASASVHGDTPAVLYEDVTGGLPLNHQWFYGKTNDVTQPIATPGPARITETGDTSGLVRMQSTNAHGFRQGEPSVLLRWDEMDLEIERDSTITLSFANGRYFAVPSDRDSPASTATTPGQWTRFDRGALGGSSPVCHAYGRYFAPTNAYTGEYATSPDGTTWTSVDVPGVDTKFHHLASNGQCLIALAADEKIYRSVDGVNWSAVTTLGPLHSGTLLALSGGNFIFTSYDGRTYRSTSDALHWFTHDVTDSPRLHYMASNGYRMVALESDRVWVSDNGSDWSEHELPSLPEDTWTAYHNIYYGAGIWVAVAGTHILISQDGISWDVTEDFIPLHNPADRSSPSLVYGDGRFMLATHAGLALQTRSHRQALHFSQEGQTAGINAGESIELSIAVTGPATAYQWFQGRSGDTSQPITGANTATWQTPALTETAHYWVQVSGAGETINSGTYEVVVATPPTIVSSPASREATTQEEVTLSFEVQSAAPLSYQWYVGESGDTSSPLPGATQAHYLALPDHLTRPYWARATNAAGSVDSAASLLTRWQVYNGDRHAQDMVQFKGRWYAAAGIVEVSDDGVLWDFAFLGRVGSQYGGIQGLWVADGALYGAGSNGLWRTLDGEHWEQLSPYGGSSVGGSTALLAQGGSIWVRTIPRLVWTDDVENPEWNDVEGVSDRLYGLVHADERFVAVGSVPGWGEAGAVVYSSFDGRTWVERTPPLAAGVDNTLNAVAHGSPGFVAVGRNGTILKSADGLSWTDVSPAAAGEVGFNDIAWGGDRFVAGVQDSRTIWWSSDGEVWHEVAGPTRFSSDVLFHIDGRFRAEGASGWAYESTDGLTWNLVSGSPKLQQSKIIEGLAAGNGLFMLLEPQEYSHIGNTATFVSSDGRSWRLVASPGRVRDALVFYEGWFIAQARYNNRHELRISADGESWQTALIMEGSDTVRRFVPLDDGLAAITFDGVIYRSTDGENWERSPYQSDFVPWVFATDGARAITSWYSEAVISSDLAHWAPLAVSENLRQIEGATYGDGRFVLGGDSPARHYVSSDTSTWVESASDTPGGADALVFADGRFMALSTYGPYLSVDGLFWRRASELVEAMQAIGLYREFPDEKVAELDGRTLVAGGLYLALSQRDPAVGGIRAVAGARVLGADDSLHLTVDAVGSDLSYQWYRGSVGDTSQPLSGATQADLALAPEDVADGDAYWVRVSSPTQSWDSETLALQVASVPVITAHPQSQEVPLEGAITLSVTATGSDTLNYQWWHDGERITYHGDSATLERDATDPDVAGDYHVVVYDVHGSTASRVATLTIPAAPVILTEPEDVTAEAGENVSFTVQVQGDSLVYQWRRNGIALPDETGPQLSLSAVSTADAGLYDVVVRNRGGTVTSTPVRLALDGAAPEPPAIQAATGLMLERYNRRAHMPFRIDGTGSKRLLLRLIGPALVEAGGVASEDVCNPSFILRDGAGTTLGESDDWNDQPDGGAAVRLANAAAGALPLAESSTDAALVVELEPGYYAMELLFTDRGPMLAEVWDLAPTDPTSRVASVGLYSRVAGVDTAPALTYQLDASPGGREIVTRHLGPALGIYRRSDQPALQLSVGGETPALIGETRGWGPSEWPQWMLADLRSVPIYPGSQDAMRIDRLDTGVYQAEALLQYGAHGQSMLEVLDPFATVSPEEVAVLVQPMPVAGSAGLTLRLDAITAGPAARTLQWSRNGEPIPGAIYPILEVLDAQPEHEGTYTLTVSHDGSSVTSLPVELDVWGGGPVRASHEKSASGVEMGETLTVTVELNWDQPAPQLSYRADLPADWTFVSDTVTTAESRPTAGATNQLLWTFGSPTANGFIRFTYTIRLAAEAEHGHSIMGTVLHTDASAGVVASEALPYTLYVTALRPHHDADTNRDRRLGLAELLRVIELYNTRAGTTRTGRYRSASATVDGYAPDPAETPDAITRHHTADTDRDGRFSLSELLRVIELYNTRNGTTRTGAYRSTVYSIDRFEPDI